MKKLDIIIILVVLIIGVSLFIYYYDKFNVDTDNAVLNIYYHNKAIVAVDYNEDMHTKTFIIRSENKNKLIVEVKETNEIIYTQDINIKKDFANHVYVSYDEIKMAYSTCPDPEHNCYESIMNKDITLPIICINGITVVFVPKTPNIGDIYS